MTTLIHQINQKLHHPDLAKLLLRIGFGGMFLMHGIHKAIDGTEFVQHKFMEIGLPGFFAHAVYLGQIIAPILIIVGIYTRLSAFISFCTSIVVILLMHSNNFFTLSKHGGWAVEGIAVYFFAFLALILLGSGKFAVKPD